MSCPQCRGLEQELAAAEQTGDRSRAVDCRVLLRRHPQHDGVPVEAGARSPARTTIDESTLEES
ncbi:hypothetical protein Stsp01_48330 [Streptomyces sp. NBRC 13847]|nr:hypothetical protein Stsp01_48330 [Streptomyces sp. NBRC 13847]